MVYNKKQIAMKYVKTWFLFDLYAFYPFGLFRYYSDWNEGGKDEL